MPETSISFKYQLAPIFRLLGKGLDFGKNALVAKDCLAPYPVLGYMGVLLMYYSLKYLPQNTSKNIIGLENIKNGKEKMNLKP